MKRHKILNIYFGKRTPGFGVITLNGTIFFPLGHKFTLSRLKKHFPHKYKEITKSNKLTEETLRKLLIGNYIYGTSKEVYFNGTVSQTLV